MSEEKSNLQWGSTEAFPRNFVKQILALSKKQQEEEEEEEAQDKDKDLVKNWLQEQRVFATEKIDGTNFSVNCKGDLFGRRLKVGTIKQCETGLKYQKVALSCFSEFDVVVENVKQKIREKAQEHHSGEPLPRIKELRLFGELGCNHIYDYKEKGFAGAWSCFGGILVFETQAAEDLWRVVLEKAQIGTVGRGIEIDKIDDENGNDSNEENLQEMGKIRLTCSPEFFRILDTNQVPHPPILFEGQLVECLKSQKDWMLGGNGEGIVLSFGSKISALKIRKWKQGHESQNADIVLLTKMLENHKNEMFQELEEILKDLLEIATTNNLKPKSQKKKVPAALIFDPKQVSEAIDSATTKFDSPDAYFQKHSAEKHHGRDVYFDLLLEEVANDLPKIKVDSDAKLEVSKSIKRHIGNQFGLFLRSKNKNKNQIQNQKQKE